MRNPEGEANTLPLRVDFDRRLKLEFHGSRITSDAGLLAYRELDDALGLTALAGSMLADNRTGKNGWHGLIGLLRQSVYGRLAGYEDVNDADRLSHDPTMRWIVGGKAVDRGGASVLVDHAGEHGDGGGLAGAVVSEERGDLPTMSREVKAVDRPVRPEGLNQTFDYDHGHGVVFVEIHGLHAVGKARGVVRSRIANRRSRRFFIEPIRGVEDKPPRSGPSKRTGYDLIEVPRQNRVRHRVARRDAQHERAGERARALAC